MATPSQTRANRDNALQSTGPKTEEGKQRAAHNATRHGLTSKSVVLPNENEDEYNLFRDNMVRDLAPAGERERILAVVVAETFWRRQRFYRLETVFFASRMNAILTEHPELPDGDDALVRMFTDASESASARLFLRYLASAERAYSKALAELRQAQAERLASESAEAKAADDKPGSNWTPAMDEAFVNATLARIGSVSQQHEPEAFGDRARSGFALNPLLK